MKKYLCNPVNISYRYQFNEDMDNSTNIQVSREAADPSMICFKGKYYIFASMTLGVWVSEDLITWENRRLLENLPLYDYAPDARVIGEYIYFSASKRGAACNFYRTKDVLNGPYEEIEGIFEFWDPNLFCDDDGRVYFYWGCTNAEPIWGVELNQETMKPIGKKQGLIYGDAFTKGYERVGEDHSIKPKTAKQAEIRYREYLKKTGQSEEQLPQEMLSFYRNMFSDTPYIEGAWMTKFRGKYYLQYACPGAEFNTYADGVYVSDNPLGPFALAENNPYSYKPGGFLPGAGHGSTMEDLDGKLWHTATMRISMNHTFERRVGILPAGFDADGEMFCNQRYGDWPLELCKIKSDPWADPEWYLLSFRKPVTASSFTVGHDPGLAADENIQTWWKAGSESGGEWLQLDLEKIHSVHAVQINFADDKIEIPVPGEIRGAYQRRYIEERDLKTRWVLEGSLDGESYFVIEDKAAADTDLPHDLVIREDGIAVRYLKLTILEVPYGQKPCISGLRVFGIGDGKKPEIPAFTVNRDNDLDMMVEINQVNATGYNILWGDSPEKLYHSYMTFDTRQKIGALVKGKSYYVRVDAFNENGITEGQVVPVPI